MNQPPNPRAHQIEIERLNKHYGAFHALRDIDVRVPRGTFVALVGPSGCGKSTLLRTLAGLEQASSGDIRIAGESVTRLPPRKRDIAMVFQSYALYPHMRVSENMTYALRLRRMAREAIEAATTMAAKTLGISPLLEKYPRELSGGQRQRVAMGRAIVREPKVFLFDEPLSNLDAGLRVHMRGEIRRLHDRLGATSVYVTHDQIEAMTMADHIVVLRAGVVEQQGPPLELYDRPANTFVAGFIGSPAMNILPARIEPDGTSARIDGTENTVALDRRFEPGRAVLVGLRPEHLCLLDAKADGELSGVIETVESTGSATYIVARLGAHSVCVATATRRRERAGDALTLSILAKEVHLFDPQTGLRLKDATARTAKSPDDESEGLPCEKPTRPQ
ncbi:ABC transporter ATP-binding protein [Aureimonas pseudogalii]|uniref:Multiple sugar transport system ATP-binding protein n=1 Tax=Aureimonas pseudogalii TaxID=1744844 RepID=A0A7W6H8Y3_9HYPH|nr:sn-glycerol-3-phosphate ABC transporter ATP-binding protein UgpC [Aureimonas pseudogalii]MBB4000776.1 multiple sugar transport system ATP-binding protein [Aureimonas pseudogalii]